MPASAIGFVKQRESVSIDAQGTRYSKFFRAFGFTDKFAMIAGAGFPMRGTADPDRPADTICTDVRVDWVKDSLSNWDIEADYSIAPLVGGTISDPEIDRQIQTIRAWRLGATVPTNIDNPSPTEDIGGLARDTQGEPFDLPLSVHMVSIAKDFVPPMPEI